MIRLDRIGKSSVLDTLLNGASLAIVFRKMLSRSPSLTGHDLSRIFVEQFPEVDGGAVQLIRRWNGVGRQSGISDADLDLGVVHFLHVARYIK